MPLIENAGFVLADEARNPLYLNDSPAAWGDAAVAGGRRPTPKNDPRLSWLPDPDVGYTYPDQNNIFLAYRE